MKKTIITITIAALALVGVCTMANTMKEQHNIIEAQTELLSLIHDDDTDTWCDVICETDEYQNLVEIYDLGF